MHIGSGIIDIGRHADLEIIPAMISAPETKLIVAFSRDRVRAEAFTRSHNLSRAYDSLDRLFGGPLIDAVYMESPNFLHAGYTQKNSRWSHSDVRYRGLKRTVHPVWMDSAPFKSLRRSSNPHPPVAP